MTTFLLVLRGLICQIVFAFSARAPSSIDRKITKKQTTKLNTLFVEMAITREEKKSARKYCAPYMGTRSPIVHPKILLLSIRLIVI